MSADQTPTRSVAASRRVRASTPEDGPAIVALMREAGLQPHAEPAHLHWKYWQERADFPGPRSFVLTDGKTLLAHGALIPGTVLHRGASEARLIHMIDWAARRDAVGAGVVLMKHIGSMTDFLLGIGGSDQTLRIMPMIGYRPCGTVTGYMRPLAPLGILARPGTRWKRAPRMARSLLWLLSAPRVETGDWQVRRLGIHEVARLAHALPGNSPDAALLGRSPELLRHALACPIVPVELHVLEKAGRIGGYFVLSYAPGQARLADLWMDSEDPAHWRALVHAAVREARRRGGLAELIAWSSDPRLSQIFDDCGFHVRLTLPIYLRSSGGLPLPEKTLRVQMIDNDAYYLYFGRNELWA